KKANDVMSFVVEASTAAASPDAASFVSDPPPHALGRRAMTTAPSMRASRISLLQPSPILGSPVHLFDATRVRTRRYGVHAIVTPIVAAKPFVEGCSRARVARSSSRGTLASALHCRSCNIEG